MVATALGDSELTSLLLISAVDDQDYIDVRKELKPVRRAALNLTVAAIKAKFNLATTLRPAATAAETGGHSSRGDPDREYSSNDNYLGDGRQHGATREFGHDPEPVLNPGSANASGGRAGAAESNLRGVRGG